MPKMPIRTAIGGIVIAALLSANLVIAGVTLAREPNRTLPVIMIACAIVMLVAAFYSAWILGRHAEMSDAKSELRARVAGTDRNRPRGDEPDEPVPA